MTGPALGHGYVPGYGSGMIFDEPSHPGFLTVQTRDGSKHFISRERVQWRRGKKEVAQ